MGWCYVDRTSPVTWVPCIVVRSLARTNHGGPGILEWHCRWKVKKVSYEGERVGAGSSKTKDSSSTNGSMLAPGICYKYFFDICYIYLLRYVLQICLKFLLSRSCMNMVAPGTGLHSTIGVMSVRMLQPGPLQSRAFRPLRVEVNQTLRFGFTVPREKNCNFSFVGEQKLSSHSFFGLSMQWSIRH